MGKKKLNVSADKITEIDENSLFVHVSKIIEKRKQRAYTKVNQETTLLYWEVGNYISSVLLGGERSAYGKQILATLSQELTKKYGVGFEYTRITRMIKFAEVFPDTKILPTLSAKLTWSHIIELLPLKTEQERMYYANDASARNLGVRDLRKQIARKSYERQEIANSQLTEISKVPFNVFKDPYLLDTFGLKENFLEADLEKAILKEIETFILEFGHGFTFVERQKRMTMGDDDFVLDLLFYHRILKRLVAVELKIGKFFPRYMGQMQFYLKWLNKYERQEGENEPIGIILCTKADRSQIELMELDKSGIAVAEYWTNLPSKTELEQKIQEIYAEAQERLERRKSLPKRKEQHQIEYFYESKDDGDDTEDDKP